MAATTKKRMQTLEEVWATVSSAIGRDLNGGNAKPLRLTPRSAAACIKHGVTPELLKIRPLESFTNRPGAVPDDVARIRHEAYVAAPLLLTLRHFYHYHYSASSCN